MVERDDFQALVNLALQTPGRANMGPVVQKELLHYDILFCLDTAGLLDALTFQGGTSLRLCYGAQRFSEDLDFVGGKDFTREQLAPIRDCIEHYIGQRYGLEVSVKEPVALRHEREHADLKIDKWQIAVTTAPGRPDQPRQRVKIEVANIDAYSRTPRALQMNYPFLPDGYGDTLVLVETLDEIMADKLVSLVNTSSHVRNRDLWDLRWLKQQGAQLRPDWVAQKIVDYSCSNYPERLLHMIERVPSLVEGQGFRQEMLRFLPQDVLERTLDKPKFCAFLAQELVTMLRALQTALQD
jgi:predicted nucleotidyltransferase component of viral defense system